MKRCSKCKEVKGLEGFSKSRSRKDGLQKQCKACQAAQQAAWRAANREKIAARKAAYRAANREKIAAYDAAYIAANREKMAAHRAAYRAANRDRMAAYCAAYSAANRERLAAYQRNRRRTDPEYRLRRNLRSRLKNALRGNYKTGSAVRDLGCSIAELRLHLESQFQPGMDWDNYGTLWDIDHIYPLSAADLSDPVEFLAVNNWRNLQPLTGADNEQKSNTVTHEAKGLFDELVREFRSRGQHTQGEALWHGTTSAGAA